MVRLKRESLAFTLLVIAVLIVLPVLSNATEPTPEEILQKVADNYAKIEDIKATMVCTGSIGEKTNYGPVEKTYIMKAPDKSKIVSPSEGETIIMDGEKKYLITEGGTIESDLTDYLDIPPTQMDFYYNLDEFIEKHNLKTIDHHNDIYILEVIPKEPNKTYSKFILHINYTKELDIKKEVYSKDGILMMSKEIVEDKEINGIVIPSKSLEKTFFVDAVLTFEAAFEDIQINTGVKDEEFEPNS